MPRPKPITVFEHEALRLDKQKGFSEAHLKALQAHYGQHGVPYYNLIHEGVKFNEYVGVIQVGQLVIEVLPKADKATHNDQKAKWRGILINMLKAVGGFDVKISSNSDLNLKTNHLLDLYFELFVRELEYLLHTGLVKQYRKKEGNLNTLKGNLQFSKHLQQNIVHQERFFVRYTTYDTQHQWHAILYKTLLLLQQLNTRPALHSRIVSLLLNFPEMPDLRVNEATFERLIYSRKTEPYRQAIQIARLLLLRYHPDVNRGRNHVLALMFDMNLLWEQFVYRSLLKYPQAGMVICAQQPENFWRAEQSRTPSQIRADIILEFLDQKIILDTKWKNLNGDKPSAADLHQMYVYHQYYAAKQVALVYPGSTQKCTEGAFLTPGRQENANLWCSVITLPVEENIQSWQKQIYNYITETMSKKRDKVATKEI